MSRGISPVAHFSISPEPIIPTFPYSNIPMEYLNKLILLHDYLYHPYYLDLRKTSNSEKILSFQLQHEIRNLAGFLKNWGDNKRENKPLFRSLTQKYPLLRQYVEEKIG